MYNVISAVAVPAACATCAALPCEHTLRLQEKLLQTSLYAGQRWFPNPDRINRVMWMLLLQRFGTWEM